MENLFVRKNSLTRFALQSECCISTNERNWILAGHVIFKLRYNQIYQLKTTLLIFQAETQSEELLAKQIIFFEIALLWLQKTNHAQHFMFWCVIIVELRQNIGKKIQTQQKSLWKVKKRLRNCIILEFLK